MSIQVLLFASLLAATPVKKDQLVRAYVDAFNRRDAAGMLALVSDKVQWLTINGDQAPFKETEGRDAMERWLVGHFKDCPSCRSELDEVIASPQRVVTLETASWTDANGRKQQQRAWAIYEFESEGKIFRVYYFSSEPAR